MKVWTLLRRVLTGALNELLGAIPALNFSSLMSATSTTIQPAGTKPLNIHFLSRTHLLILPCSAQCSLTC